MNTTMKREPYDTGAAGPQFMAAIQAHNDARNILYTWQYNVSLLRNEPATTRTDLAPCTATDTRASHTASQPWADASGKHTYQYIRT